MAQDAQGKRDAKVSLSRRPQILPQRAARIRRTEQPAPLRFRHHHLSGQALTYDADGNLLLDGVRNLSWDAENRLVGITYPGSAGKATAFTYDGRRRRVAITSTPAGGGSAVTTSYLWCGSRICQARNAANTTTREYYSEGELLPGGSPQPYHYGVDQIGSVRRVFASASSAPGYGYDPYGTALQTTAPLTDFNYAGMFYNADSGLYLTQYRAYDPGSGRWLSRDPLGEGADHAANLYSYVGNDPLNLTDPTGRFGWVGLAIGAGAGFAAGYETGGLKGAVLGGIVGGGVGIFAPWVSGEVGGFVGGLTGSATAGAIASAGTFSALGAAAGAGATVVTNLATGQLTFDDVGNGALIGGAAPLLSGEAALVGLGEAGAATYGLSGLADWASLQTGVFGALGTAADAGVNQSGVFAPGTAAASPSGPQCH